MFPPIHKPAHRLALIILLALLAPRSFARHAFPHPLNKLGHRVSLAKNGDQAVAALLQGQLDLILIDRMLPGIEFGSAIAQIRSLEAANRSTSRIIVLLPDGMQEDWQRCRGEGADSFVVNPIRFDALKSAIESAVNGTSEQAGAGS